MFRLDPLAAPEMEAERAPTPATRTVEIQTDYRDSETQTDPYTPEYVVRPGSQPELLTLATLSYGKLHSFDLMTFVCLWVRSDLSWFSKSGEFKCLGILVVEVRFLLEEFMYLS